uniref:C2 domain-containing protein n=1 Tax=Parastrongyloides trichosuri TaxID=131310 RepID=A0A0N4ZMP4_PARTI
MNFDISNFETNIYGDVNDDEELLKELKSLGIDENEDSDCEAELARLMKDNINVYDEDALLSELEDKNSKRGCGKRKIQDDDNLEDDEDILNELNEITGDKNVKAPNPINNGNIDNEMMGKLTNAMTYYVKQLDNAKKDGENSKIRRYQRSVDKIKELQQLIQKGKSIDESEIPPLPQGFETHGVANKVRKLDDPPAIPQKPNVMIPNKVSETKEEKLRKVHSLLRQRLAQYMDVAQQAKDAGDKEKTMEYIEFVTNFKNALEAINISNIDDCDINDIPPAPEPFKSKQLTKPKNLVEDLTLRRQFYVEYIKQLTTKGEDRKVRSNQRIVGIFDEAISIAKKGKLPDISSLPCPPGMEPITMNYGSTSQQKVAPPSIQVKQQNSGAPSRPISDISTMSNNISKIDYTKLSKQEAQSYFLRRRLARFKQQAVAAKHENDMEHAKEYLRIVKGIEPMIKASDNGLPADLRKVPTPPQLSIPNSALKCTIVSNEPFFNKIEKTLIKQLAYCLQNLSQVVGQNDAINALVYEELTLETLEDVVFLRQSARANRLPKFHYIDKILPRAQLNLDLDDATLEFTIHSAMNIKPLSGYKDNDLCCYIKYEFPYPHGTHQVGTTSVVNYTNCPEFNEKIILKIGRSARAYQRIVARSKLKLEIYHKAGFLRSDKLVGNVDVPLAELEHFATVAMKLPILEGRRKTDGIIEVAFRQSKAIGTPKMDSVKEKWLLLIK